VSSAGKNCQSFCLGRLLIMLADFGKTKSTFAWRNAYRSKHKIPVIAASGFVPMLSPRSETLRPSPSSTILRKISRSKLDFRERWLAERAQPSCFSGHDVHMRQIFWVRGLLGRREEDSKNCKCPSKTVSSKGCSQMGPIRPEHYAKRCYKKCAEPRKSNEIAHLDLSSKQDVVGSSPTGRATSFYFQ
jgi:hypothetical protein